MRSFLKKNESILHIIKKIIIKKDTFKNLYILSLYKSWKIFSIYNLFLKIYNNRNLFFGDTSYVYFHIQFKIFDGGGTTSSLFYSVCAGERLWRR